MTESNDVPARPSTTRRLTRGYAVGVGLSAALALGTAALLFTVAGTDTPIIRLSWSRASHSRRGVPDPVLTGAAGGACAGVEDCVDDRHHGAASGNARD